MAWWNTFYTQGSATIRVYGEYLVEYTGPIEEVVSYIKPITIGVSYIEPPTISISYIEPIDIPVIITGDSSINITYEKQ